MLKKVRSNGSGFDQPRKALIPLAKQFCIENLINSELEITVFPALPGGGPNGKAYTIGLYVLSGVDIQHFQESGVSNVFSIEQYWNVP